MKKYIAFCGLDCEFCEARFATANNDDALRRKVAKEWSEMNGVTRRFHPSQLAFAWLYELCHSGPVPVKPTAINIPYSLGTRRTPPRIFFCSTPRISLSGSCLSSVIPFRE